MRGEMIFKRIWVALCELFCVVTLVCAVVTEKYGHIGLCVLTIASVLIPAICEARWRLWFSKAAFVLFTAYAFGPLLGSYYGLYHTTSWWDKALHACGGVVFVLIGIYLFSVFSQSSFDVRVCAVFAFCFSVTVALLWEFFEFGCDRLLMTDMQHDTVVTSLHSYLLGAAMGQTGGIDNIHSVAVNGQPLPVGGYVDIGLIDTMWDMLVETIGAAATATVFWKCSGNRALFRLKKQPDNKTILANTER